MFLIFFLISFFSSFFLFNDTATTEIYTLSLHDALPIYSFFGNSFDIDFISQFSSPLVTKHPRPRNRVSWLWVLRIDRKSTRLNSSHPSISYAVFCLKKKKK